MSMQQDKDWINVCQNDDLVANSGICAFIERENTQIAIFKLCPANDEKVVAISNWDPIGKANVLYRGLLASVEESSESDDSVSHRYVVASPLYKQRFCLQTGQCLDDESVQVQVFPVRLNDDFVQIDVSALSA